MSFQIYRTRTFKEQILEKTGLSWRKDANLAIERRQDICHLGLSVQVITMFCLLNRHLKLNHRGGKC